MKGWKRCAGMVKLCVVADWLGLSFGDQKQVKREMTFLSDIVVDSFISGCFVCHHRLISLFRSLLRGMQA